MKNNKEKTAKEKKFAKSLVAGAVGVTSLIAMVSFTGCGEDKNKEPGAFTVSISSELEGFEGRDITVNKGTKIKDLKSMFVSPVKGYQVAGFFSDFLCTKEYDDEELVDENTKIFIKFVIETYTVRVYGERRNANPELLCDPITVNYNEFAVVETPTKESDERGTYKFAGWEDINGNPVDLSTLKITEDIDVYATFVLDQQAEYSIGVIPKGVTVTRGGNQTSIVESNTKLAYGERVKITYELSEGHRFIDFSVTGADEVAGANNWYEVHGDVKIVFEQEAIKYVVGNIPEQVKIFRVTKTEDGEQREALASGSEVTHGDILDITHVPTVGKHKTKLDVSGIFPLGGEQFGVSVTGNITIDYEEDWNTAIVKLFNDDKKELLLGKTVKHGEGVEAETPTKPSNPLDYTNVFTCWVDEDGKPFDISKIELPTYDEKNPEPVINVYASYRKEYVYYDVSIPANVTVTNDGVKLGAGDKVNYGDELIITYKEDIGKHKNVFTVNGESKENSDIFVVTGNVNIVYEQKLNTATFKFDTGSEIVEVEVEHGKNVAVPTDPTKAQDNTYTYAFAGWVDKAGKSVNFENVSVLSNESVVEVYAKFNPTYIEYEIAEIPANVTIKKGETKLSSTDTLHYDDEITVTYEETTGYDMSNFAVNGATRQGETNTYKVTGNVSVAYSEVYETYSVLNVPTGVTVVRESDSKSLKTGDTITFNDKLTISYSLTEGHHLKTFAVNGTAYETNDVKLSVAGELSVEFVEEINKYTVVFKNYDGTKLDEVIVDFGAAASTTVVGAKDSTAKYTYTFAGWVDSEGSTVSLDAITENKEVFASFAETLNNYNLSLTGDVSVVRDGKVLTAADSIHIDDVLTLTYTEQTGYHKTSFTVNGTECVNGVTYTVVGDTTVVYAEEKNEATYIFYVEGTVVKSISAKHGENVELPTTPTKNADTKYTYVFDNWCDETLSNVVKLSDISVLINGSTVKVYARFVENYIDYSVSVSNENRITVTDSKGNVLSADSKVHVDDVLTITYSLSEGHHMTNFTVSGATRQGETNNYIVTGTVNVVYSEDIDTFKVVFMDYDKTTKLDEITVNWGTAASITAPTRVQDERYTYEFRAWTDADGKDVDLSSVKEAVTVYAAYSSTLREYTIAAIPVNVTIKKGETKLSSADTLHYDDEITVTYEETAGFDMSNFAVNGATRQGETNTYKVTGNVSVAYSEVYETYSVLSVPAGVTVIRESDSKSLKTGDAITFNDKLTISFALSDGHHLVDFTVNGTAYETNDVKLTVTGDLTIEFEEEINLYNVRFYDDDKSFIEGVEVEWNKAATTTEVPTKDSDATYTYEFANWVDADGNVVLLDHVKSNMNVYASYSKTYIEYTINILKGIGNVSITKGGKPLSIDDTVHFGDTIVISYKESVGYHEDLFEINNRMSANNVEFVVDGNVEISYQEEANMATYYFYDDGRVYDTVTVRHGENVELPANPTKDADGTYTYEFVRWLAANKKDAAVLENVQVLADGSEVCVYSDYKATYIEYTIEIPEYVTVKKNGKVITSEDTLHFNEEIVISYNLREGYHVKNFTLNGTLIETNNFVTQVTSNMTIVFEDEINTYEVVFKDENKTTILGNATVNYNAAAALETIPTKDSDDIYDYTFAGWVDAEGNAVSLEHVKANTTVYASYSSTYIEYSIVIPSNVTVTKGGKTISSTDTLHYGDKIVVLYSESAGYHKTSFKINGTEQTANGAEFSVVGNTTISYEEAKNTATVVFVSEGKEHARVDVKHGENVKLPAEPSKESDSTYTYEFAGWLGSDGNAATLENVQVLSDGSTFTVTAKFNPVYIEYSLTIPDGVTVKDSDGNTLSADSKVHFGDKVEIVYAERTGYHKTSFKVDGTEISVAAGVTYQHTVAGNLVIEYADAINTYLITIPRGVSVTRDGEPLADGDVVSHFDSLVVSYALDEGFHIDTFAVNGTAIENGDTVVVSGNVEVSFLQEENTATYKFFNENTLFAEVGAKHGENVVIPANPTKAADNTYTYSFAKWVDKNGKDVSFENIAVATDGLIVEVYASYSSSYIEYTIGAIPANVTIKKGETKLSSTDTLHYDDEITVTYEETTGYDMSNFAVNGATRQGETNTYKVTGNVSVAYSEVYETYSVLNVPTGVTVIRESDSKSLKTGDTITFNDKLTISYSLTEGHHLKTFTVNGTAYETNDVKLTVTGVLNVQFAEEIDTFNVVFVDENKTTILGNTTVNYNAAAALETVPTKDSDDIYDYTFAGWVDAEGNAVSLEHVKANTTVYASYSSTYIEYSIVIPSNVTVTKGGKTISSTDTLHYGDKIVVLYSESAGYHKTSFKINGTEQTANGVEFSVVGNTTISYEEAKNTATVIFVSEGEQYATASVKHGENVKLPAEPSKESDSTYTYEFAGWLGSDGNAATLENVQVLSDGSTFTVTAKFNPVYIDYSLTIPSGVSVSDAEGNVLENGETLHFGDEIIVSYTEKTGFHKTVFTVNGESKNNGDKIVVDGATTIVYEQSENTATYKFISGGKVISSVNVKHGQNVTVPAKPTKAADNIYTYEFENWYLEEVSDPNEPNKPRPLSDIDFENVSVLQDQSVVNIYACFEKTYIEYSLTIPSGVKVLKGGKELSRTDTLHYGDKITVSYEENTGFHKTVFTVNGENKNSGDEVVVSGNTTIVFNQMENQATYKFFADGKLVSSTTVLHGGNVEAPIVQKTADSKYTYGNYGWSLTEQEELCTAEYAEQNPLPAVSFENISVETDGAEVVYYMHFYTVFVEYSVSIVDEAPANVVVKKGDEVVDTNTVLHFDDVITITCTPNEGYETTKFVVNGATDLGDGTYKVTGNVSIEYVEDYKSFAIVVPENVTVLRNDEAVTSDSIIRYNDELVISYTPSEGHHMTTFTVNGETFTNGGTLVVSGNITIVYAEAINTYTVTFMNEDRTETLGTVTVDYNTAATFAAPEKPTNIPYSYTFTGWVDAEGNAVSLENIKEDITVSPVYETVNMYPYLQFSQIGDTYAVSGIKLDGYTDYVIPATYLGNPVTEISDMAFYGFDNMKSITIPASITWIGSEAIRSCNSLETVTFLGTIDDWAQIEISDCTSLRQAKLLIGGVEVKDVVLTSATKITMAFADRNITSIKIPSTVQTIHNRAFQGCTSLASVTVDSSSIYSKLAAGENCGYLVDNAIRLKILASIDDGSNEYVVDNFVKVATADGYNEYVSAEYLFVLEESDASYKITGVKDNTVSEIQIPNCLRGKPISEIGAFAFSDCNKLAAVTLSKNIKVVGEGAFEGCNRITEVNYLGTISSWANISFGSENANPIYYSQKLSINGVEVVGDITISGVASISNYAFYNCKNIRGLTIAGIVTQTSIGNSAFIYCTDLEYVEMSRVSTIGANAFAGCTKLAEVIVAAETESIGNNAFNGCSALEFVTIESATVYGALTSADACGGLIKNATNIKVSKTADAGTNEYLLGNFVKTDSDDYFEYVSADEVLVFTAVEGGGYTVSGFKEGVVVENITIPATYNNQSVTSIANNAFDGNTSLKNVTLSEGITSVGDLAFNGATNLEIVTFPNSLTTFGDGAFKGCSSLRTVTIPENVTTIGFMTFENCTNLETINFNATNMADPVDKDGEMAFANTFVNAGINGAGIDVNIGENVTRIPNAMFAGLKSEAQSMEDSFVPTKIKTVNFAGNKVTEIGMYAFAGCKELISITIPESVTSIKALAFAYCTGLETINFNAINTSCEASVFAVAGRDGNGIALSVGENVTRIPEGMFYGDNLNGDGHTSPKLKTVAFAGDKVTEIGEMAFAFCKDLTNIVIPESVTTIGEYAFAYCTSVQTIEYNAANIVDKYDSEGNVVLSSLFLATGISGSGITLNVGENVTNIPAGLFVGENPDSTGDADKYISPKITNINFAGNKLLSIGERAFDGCSELVGVNLPTGMTTIAKRAFYNCSGLASITIPESVTTIGTEAFAGCTALQTINYNTNNIVDSVDAEGNLVENKVFTSAGTAGSGITLNIGANVTKIPAGLFAGTINQDTGAIVGGPKFAAVNFGANVAEIGMSAFMGAQFTCGLVLPTGVTTIAKRAFYNCSGLASITIPESVTTIGAEAFAYCTGVETLNYNTNNIADLINESGESSENRDIFLNLGTASSGVTLNIAENVTRIPAGLFAGTLGEDIISGPKFAVINFGANVTEIGEAAFAMCQFVNPLVLPTSVTTIGVQAFVMADVESVEILGNVTRIENGTFMQCTNLKSVVLPSTLKVIDAYAFVMCGLESLTIPGSVEEINCAFAMNANLTTLVVEEGCTAIGDQAFIQCSSLANITLPSTLKTLDSRAFAECTALKSITIPGSVTTFVASFLDCTGLETVVIEDGVTVVGNGAFQNCSSLKNVVIPDSVQSLGYSAFAGCSNLASIIIGSNVSTVNTAFEPFKDCTSLAEVVIRSSYVYKNASSKTALGGLLANATTIKVLATADDGTNTYLNSNFVKKTEGDYNVYTPADEQTKAAWQYLTFEEYNDGYQVTSLNSAVIDVYIPVSYKGKKVISIADNAFSNENNINLTNVTISESVINIGIDAFNTCTSLASIKVEETNIKYTSKNGSGNEANCIIEKESKTLVVGCKNTIIPSDGSVTTIGYDAFIGCTGLTTIIIPDCITNIVEGAFDSCGLINITIPSSVTSIDAWVFVNCTGLTSITIPGNITAIGEGAFASCTNLATVIIENSDIYKAAVGTGHNNIGALLENATTIKVLASADDGTNTYLNNNFVKTTETVDGKTYNVYSEPDEQTKAAWQYLSYTETSDGSAYEVTGPRSGSLKDVFIPAQYKGKAVTGIRDNAFRSYTALTSLTIPSSVTSIGNKAFYDCSNLASIMVADGNAVYTSRDNSGNKVNCIINKSTKELIVGSKNSTITNDGSVTSIGDSAFSGCTGLTSITIPSSVESIGDSAFSGCTGLTSITIPSSVKSIKTLAFQGCTGLISVNLEEGLTLLGSYMFAACTGLTNITIPSSMTSIGYYAFYLCTNLTNVIIKSADVYAAATGTDYNQAGNLLANATKIKVLASIDDGSNTYLNSNFIKTTDGNYNVYTKSFTVTFMDEDKSTVLGTEKVATGSQVQTSLSPTKASTAQYEYTFAGWVNSSGNAVDLSTITSSTTVYAKYNQTTRSYAVSTPSGVTVKNGSTTLSNGAEVPYGTNLTISYSLSTGYHMTAFKVNGSNFTNGGTHTVTGAVNIAFTQAANTATYKFYVDDKLYITKIVSHGGNITISNPQKEDEGDLTFVFDKWVTTAGGSTAATLSNVSVLTNETTVNIYAKFNTYTLSSYTLSVKNVGGVAFAPSVTSSYTGKRLYDGDRLILGDTLTLSVSNFSERGIIKFENGKYYVENKNYKCSVTPSGSYTYVSGTKIIANGNITFNTSTQQQDSTWSEITSVCKISSPAQYQSYGDGEKYQIVLVPKDAIEELGKNKCLYSRLYTMYECKEDPNYYIFIQFGAGDYSQS